MVSHEKDRKNIEILLPNESSETVDVHSSVTVSDLKIVCEDNLGIPAEFIEIFAMTGSTDKEITDGDLLNTNIVRLQVPIWWKKFICNILNNDIHSAYRRVQLPMQRVGKDERIFVAMFMACCRGMVELLCLLVELKTMVSLETCTSAGRSLVHACAIGGHLECLEIVVKHLSKGCNNSFERLDNTDKSALEIAQSRGHKEITEKLLQYNMDKTNMNVIKISPHQKQSNSNDKINTEHIANERLVDQDKQVCESNDYSTNRKQKELVVNSDSMTVNTSRRIQQNQALWSTNSDLSPNTPVNTSRRIQQNQALWSTNSDLSPNTPATKHLTNRAKENNFKIIKTQVQQDEEKNLSFLPSLTLNNENQLISQVASLPGSPNSSSRTSPVNEIIEYYNSAPNSPKSGRRQLFRVAGIAARFAMTPTPPRTQMPRNVGERVNGIRRVSLVNGIEEGRKKAERRKSRSVCEVTLRESLSAALYKNMESGPERIELPWNAWIAAKRQETQQPAAESTQLTASKSPGNRRRSFVQWLNDKDLDALRNQHAEYSRLEVLEEEGTLGKKGKSFEEWLEDKHTESKKEKDKEKEKEEAMKLQEETKIRRRRMSQQKYQSWLLEKERRALEAEEKLLGEAKSKLEKMKLKWEEEDEIRKKNGMKVNRTKSCPAKTNYAMISRHRFSSLNNK